MKICILVNDTSHGVMGLRARNITAHLPSSYQVDIHYREAGKLEALRRFSRIVKESRPDMLYVMNVGYAGGGAALMAKVRYGIPYLLDHGDPSYELLKSSGRPRWEYWLVRMAEWTMLRAADVVIARGKWLADQLREQLKDRIFFLPDGVDTDRFKPMDVSDLRREYNIGDALTIGVIGSIVWSERFQMCYGWDVIEAIHRLPEKNVKGVIVGDGSGVAHLKQRAEAYGISDRICFTGRVPHEEVPRYINLMNICISTQTNDAVGQSRTTAKLPEYLACGRFIIATDVGGARDVVRDNGFLLPYDGVYDPDHPDRLVERIEQLVKNPDLLTKGLTGIAIAQKRFEYQQLSHQLANILESFSRS